MQIFGPLIFSLKESIIITAIIFLLMVFIEAFVLKYQERIIRFLKEKKFMGYIVASLFGSIPGCLGVFAMDTLYMSGLLGFGGIIAAMIATSGDEAFLLIGMAASGEISWGIVFILMGVLFIVGIVGGYLADIFRKRSKMKLSQDCEIKYHRGKEFKLKHFFKEHVVNHILKKHIWQIFFWLFGAIFVIELLQGHIDFDFSGRAMFVVLLVASMIALFPISGPNVVLIVLFSKGLVPFSVLLANSIIQDGHGLLPIIGYSLKDAIKIKAFNFVFGLAIGIVLLSVGL